MSQEDAANPPAAAAADLPNPAQETDIREDPPFLPTDRPWDSAPATPEPRVFDAQAHAATARSVEKVLADLHDKEVE
jgi:hypothetical protein